MNITEQKFDRLELNNRVAMIANSIELASMVIANIDSDLIADKLDDEQLTLTMLQKAISARLALKLNIKE